jgi:hypothetical protein
MQRITSCGVLVDSALGQWDDDVVSGRLLFASRAFPDALLRGRYRRGVGQEHSSALASCGRSDHAAAHKRLPST